MNKVQIVYDVDQKQIGVEIFQSGNWVMIPTGELRSLITDLCWKLETLDPESAAELFRTFQWL